jgi:hypothetical protein
MAPSSEIIDLVESGDDVDASAIASSSAAMKKTNNKNGRDEDDDVDDDDSSVEFLDTASPNQKPNRPPAAKKARLHHHHRESSSSSSKEQEGAVNDQEDTREEQEPEEDRKPAALVKKENSKSKTALTRLEENDDDDDIQLVDAAPHMVPEEPPKNVPPFASMADPDENQSIKGAAEDEEDEIAVVGTRHPRVRLPHMRQHCTDYPFIKISPPPLFIKQCRQNTAHCELCYCYICDVPVKQCNDWSTHHCNATDTGPDATRYQRLRQAKRLDKERLMNFLLPPPPPQTSTIALTPLPAHSSSSDKDDDIPHHHDGHSEDQYSDDDDDDSGVYYDSFGVRRNMKQHRNQPCQYCQTPNDYDFDLWCRTCGRTKSKVFYKKSQAKMKKENKVLLLEWGRREIPFRLTTRDLRTEWPFADHWARHADDKAWTIDLVAEARDVFQRMLGPQPTIADVTEALSRYRDETVTPEEERDTIYLDDPKQASVLRALQMCNPMFGMEKTGVGKETGFGGNISVAFDAKQRRGVSFVVGAGRF